MGRYTRPHAWPGPGCHAAVRLPIQYMCRYGGWQPAFAPVSLRSSCTFLPAAEEGRAAALSQQHQPHLCTHLHFSACLPACLPAAEEGRAAALLSQQLVRIETGLDLPPVQEPLDQLR